MQRKSVCSDSVLHTQSQKLTSNYKSKRYGEEGTEGKQMTEIHDHFMLSGQMTLVASRMSIPPRETNKNKNKIKQTKVSRFKSVF